MPAPLVPDQHTLKHW